MINRGDYTINCGDYEISGWCAHDGKNDGKMLHLGAIF